MSLELIEAARVLGFSPEQGWPETFTAGQAMALQSWQPDQDRKAWNARCADLRTLFNISLKAATVQVRTTTTTKQVQKSASREVTFASAHWDGEPGKRRVVHWVEDVTTTTHHVTAQDFAAWLAANDIEPSRHVAAWFDVVGAGALRLVEEAIDTESALHRAWMTEAKRGRVRAALLLGVLLWAIGEEKPNPHTDHAIVEGWAVKLTAATVEKWRSGRAVRPLDPVTLIEIEGQPKGLKWVMTLEDADDFLEAHALAFKCSDVLAYWRGEPSPYSEEPPAAKVEQVESKEARQDRRLQACIDAGLPMNERALLRLPDGVGELAKSDGVTRQAFTEDVKAALRRKLDSERPKPRLVKPK